MTSFTHMPFGLLAAEFTISALNYEVDEGMMALAAIGSLVPDIDHPGSAVGWLFSITGIPQYLERRFGHRQITHSWLVVIASTLIALPLLAWRDWTYVLAFVTGVFSHVLLDMANLTGVPLFWPHPARWVFPYSRQYRIEVGSTAEFVLAAIILVLVTAFTPISVVGMRSAFYYLTKNVYGAIQESTKHFPENEMAAQVRGTWRDSQLPMDYDEKFRLVAIDQDNIFVARGDAVFSVGGAFGAAAIDQITVYRTKPVHRRADRFTVEYLLLDELEDRLPPGAIVTGTLIVDALEDDQKNADYITQSEEYPTLEFDKRGLGRDAERITIRYCPTERIRRALFDRAIFVQSGTLTVTRSEARS